MIKNTIFIILLFTINQQAFSMTMKNTPLKERIAPGIQSEPTLSTRNENAKQENQQKPEKITLNREIYNKIKTEFAQLIKIGNPKPRTVKESIFKNDKIEDLIVVLGGDRYPVLDSRPRSTRNGIIILRNRQRILLKTKNQLKAEREQLEALLSLAIKAKEESTRQINQLSKQLEQCSNIQDN